MLKKEKKEKKGGGNILKKRKKGSNIGSCPQVPVIQSIFSKSRPLSHIVCLWIYHRKVIWDENFDQTLIV
jgi:hypothetical protein